MSRTSEPAAERRGGSIGTLLADLEPHQRPACLAVLRCTFAAIAMLGEIAFDGGGPAANVAANAVEQADALLAELSKPTPGGGS